MTQCEPDDRACQAIPGPAGGCAPAAPATGITVIPIGYLDPIGRDKLTE